MEAESAFVLCHTDGRIVAENPMWRQWFAAATDCTHLQAAAARLACPQLWPLSSAAVEAGAVEVQIGSQSYLMHVHTLGEWLLLEFTAAEQDRAAQAETDALLDMGRLTSRLIHDFRNQMGGLKLYASYLKKRLAGAEAGTAGQEGAEIADKIIEGLNTMAEHATLVSRMTKPIELRCETGELAALVEQLVSEQRLRATPRHVQLVSGLADDLLELPFDVQQLHAALTALLARAIEVSPPQTTVTVTLQRDAEDCVLTVTDAGARLTDAQRAALFDFLTHERLNKNALELAHAKRILEAHGGSLVARAAGKVGTSVQVRLKI
ncbi:MAG: HAMP domain-containing histidine kinase [Acidobacteria bacterium]|nr:HAMP domain-containing histidine kinase [Acidobacteriota bacterium]MBI3422177.1 HAMP domain-containing histidine kinase [Acidobacteriota bacterium]